MILENGIAELNNISGLAGGEHFVNVTYNGGKYYAAKNSTEVGFNVTPTDNWKMNITKTERPYGENTTINIELPENVADKNVTIMIGDKPYVVNITNGRATLTVNNLSAGFYMASVNYTGDANYTSKLQKFSVQIVKAKPTVNLTDVGNDVIATVSGNATGNVTFHINGRDYTIDLVNGNATLPNNLTYGNNFVVAVYNGDGNYTDAYAMKNFIVDPITTDMTVDATPSVVVGKNTTKTVTMVNVTDGKVIIEVNGYNYTVKNNSSGVATLVVE